MSDAGEAKASTSRDCSGRELTTDGLVLGSGLGADEDSAMSTGTSARAARRRTARWAGGGSDGGSVELGDGDAGENIGGGGGTGATANASSIKN